MTRRSPWAGRLKIDDTDILTPVDDLRALIPVALGGHSEDTGLGDAARAAEEPLTARLAPILGLAGLMTAALGLVAANQRWTDPFSGFKLFLAGFVLGGVSALLCGLLGWRAGRAASQARTSPKAIFGSVLGLLLLGLPLLLAALQDNRLPIRDISTDLEDPPRFQVLAERTGLSGDYPRGDAETPRLQQQHYPDVAPIFLSQSPEQAYETVLAATEDLGWQLASANREEGMLETEAESGLFRFVDDVVLRLRPVPGGGTRVDARSASRVGRSDLGANARRLQDLAGALGTSP